MDELRNRNFAGAKDMESIDWKKMQVRIMAQTPSCGRATGSTFCGDSITWGLQIGTILRESAIFHPRSGGEN